MQNKKKLSILAFMAAVVASMAFVSVSSGGIKTVLGQGTNKTSMSSMNMTGKAGSSSGNMPGMGGMSSSMGGGGDMPGTLNQMCHMGNDMPAHYCEPSYHVMSSVQGVKVSAVSPLNNNSLT
ncbi:MAG: hypothetical protein WBP64_18665, partial [Nitrososphaeraceae archaeon]